MSPVFRITTGELQIRYSLPGKVMIRRTRIIRVHDTVLAVEAITIQNQQANYYYILSSGWCVVIVGAKVTYSVLALPFRNHTITS